MAYSNPEIVRMLSKDFDVNAIQPWQIRVNGKIDIFPKTKKFFLLSTRTWGRYKSVKVLLEKELGRGKEGKRLPVKGFQAWLDANPGPNEIYHVQVKRRR